MAVTSLLSGPVEGGTGATVVAEVGPGVPCRLLCSESADYSAPVYSNPVVSDADGYAKLAITGLSPRRRYHFKVERAGAPDPMAGMFQTLPVVGQPASFMIAHSSCVGQIGGVATPSNHRVFDAIRARDPLLFILHGDFGYNIPSGATAAHYRQNLREQITQSRQAALFANVPLLPMWDDHDFYTDNSDGTNPSKAIAAACFRQMYPHPPLAALDSVNYSVTIGRFKFIVTDNRYHRTPNSATDDASKTVLGAVQKEWFKEELYASRNDPHQFWVDSNVWPVEAPFFGTDTDKDHWGAFATERAEIDNFRSAEGIRNVSKLSGDMHALGIRLAADYSDAQDVPMNVYQASALDATPLGRGLNWDQRALGRGQYATLRLHDDGDNSSMLWEGWRTNPTTGVDERVMRDQRRFTGTGAMAGQAVPVRVWNGTEWVNRSTSVWNGADYDKFAALI
ncbi:MAG: hypothetical protein EON59_00635 [Alphaproteobacteria bacterium]|nr:MAG: hypothetical protein EON59_00635 [Alphaproteobacteria bacterium]